MTETFAPIRLRIADLDIISSRKLSPHEVAQPIRLESSQVCRIARREFRIDEIALLYRSDLAPRRVAGFPEDI